jgi:hypothetical protein
MGSELNSEKTVKKEATFEAPQEVPTLVSRTGIEPVTY